MDKKEQNKELYIKTFKEKIERNGSEKLLDYICNYTDFFIAPASTRFHGAYEGGLCEHHLAVYDSLKKINEAFNQGFSEESMAVVALTHDLCKFNFYKIDFKNQKNSLGIWEKVPYYAIEDQMPLGHGEKSLAIVMGYMRLKPEEMMAIRWHMGGWDDSVKGGSYTINGAYDKYPLCSALHAADLLANYVIKK